MNRAPRHPSVALVAGLGLAAVAALLWGGATRFGAPRLHWTTSTRTANTPSSHHTTAPQATAPTGHLLTWLVVAIVVVVLVAVALAVIRIVPRLRARKRARQYSVRAGLPALSPTAPPAQPDAPAIRHGLRAALDALAAGREPRDAVIEAWLGLQAAAAESGVRRREAETPSEFTARVITRVGADGEAAAKLVLVYQSARFSRHPTTPADVDAARAAVGSLLESWHAPTHRDGR